MCPSRDLGDGLANQRSWVEERKGINEGFSRSVHSRDAAREAVVHVKAVAGFVQRKAGWPLAQRDRWIQTGASALSIEDNEIVGTQAGDVGAGSG